MATVRRCNIIPLLTRMAKNINTSPDNSESRCIICGGHVIGVDTHRATEAVTVHRLMTARITASL